MYQQTLGRFQSRDPLAENGFDVMTDTGFYGERLASMRANPWYYSGNGENRYVYVINNPVNLTDPSGLAPCAPAEEHWVNVCCILQRDKETPIRMTVRCNTRGILFSGFEDCCLNSVMRNYNWRVLDMKLGLTCLEAFPPKPPPVKPGPPKKNRCIDDCVGMSEAARILGTAICLGKGGDPVTCTWEAYYCARAAQAECNQGVDGATVIKNFMDCVGGDPATDGVKDWVKKYFKCV
jgi:hypothetical protein